MGFQSIVIQDKYLSIASHFYATDFFHNDFFISIAKPKQLIDKFDIFLIPTINYAHTWKSIH